MKDRLLALGALVVILAGCGGGAGGGSSYAAPTPNPVFANADVFVSGYRGSTPVGQGVAITQSNPLGFLSTLTTDSTSMVHFSDAPNTGVFAGGNYCWTLGTTDPRKDTSGAAFCAALPSNSVYFYNVGVGHP